jgi:NhaA family Na+:H+ antiporter
MGAGIWLAFLKSGVHPTVAGVLLGFLTTSWPWVGAADSPNVLTKVLERLVKSSDESPQKQRHRALSRVATTAREGTSPLERLEFGLHPWVAFLIMPLFALANAGVGIEVASLGSPVALAVATGLVLGKPIGIVLFSWIATKLGLARLPAEVNWMVMLGAACLAGIGFTMSIFIAGLALQGNLLDDGKIGTLVGSTISAVFGCVLLLMFMPKRPEAPVGAQEQESGDEEIRGAQVSEENYQAQCEDRWRDDVGDDQH